MLLDAVFRLAHLCGGGGGAEAGQVGMIHRVRADCDSEASGFFYLFPTHKRHGGDLGSLPGPLIIEPATAGDDKERAREAELLKDGQSVGGEVAIGVVEGEGYGSRALNDFG